MVPVNLQFTQGMMSINCLHLAYVYARVSFPSLDLFSASGPIRQIRRSVEMSAISDACPPISFRNWEAGKMEDAAGGRKKGFIWADRDSRIDIGSERKSQPVFAHMYSMYYAFNCNAGFDLAPDTRKRYRRIRRRRNPVMTTCSPFFPSVPQVK